MWTWTVTYQYTGGTVVEEIQASNLSECLHTIASKERVRPALMKRLTVALKEK